MLPTPSALFFSFIAGSGEKVFIACHKATFMVDNETKSYTKYKSKDTKEG